MAQTILRLIHDNRMIEINGPADITRETTDAIVNAANSSLMGGGGVDGAIHRAAGPAVLQACRDYVASHGRLPAGKAMLTRGGRLAAKYVIHTVGPVYRGGTGGEAELLASCHRESIRLADKNGLSSISFPAISTGAYGYPLHEAAEIALNSIVEPLRSTASIVHVRFVLFDDTALKAYAKAAERVLRDHKDWDLDNSLE